MSESKALHLVRRQAELMRKAERIAWVPQYIEQYNGVGECIAARYVGHRRTLARGTSFPTLHSASGARAERMAPLTANMSKPLDLTRAPARALQMWRDAL